jgi:hypothetical protein
MDPLEILREGLAGARIGMARPKAPQGMAKVQPPAEASWQTFNSFAALLKYQTQVVQGVVSMREAAGIAMYGGRRWAMPYPDLRALADEADLIRIAIEDVKSTIVGLDWELTVEKGQTLDPEAEALVKSPDGDLDWDAWASQLLEEAMVTDCAAVFPWFKGGKLTRMELLDGTTLALLPDDTGRLPNPPDPAYSQPQPRGADKKYTKDQLWLLIRNRRVGTLRGFSPVEQVAARASINLAKVVRDLNRWLKGGTPAGILGTPDMMNDLEDLQKYQKWLDEMRSKPGADSSLLAVAGNPKVQVIPPLQITKEHEELLARVICKAIGSDPTSLVSDVNRASADALQRWAAIRGVWPWLWFLSSIADRALSLAGFKGHRLTWKAEREAEDYARRTQQLEEYKAGLQSWEDMRESLGKESEPEDIKDKHFVVIGGSYQLFDPMEEKQPTPPATGFAPGKFPTDPNPPDGGAGQNPAPTSPQDKGGKPLNKAACSCGREVGGFYKAAYFRAQEREDLRRWERVCRKALKAGEQPKRFESEFIPAWKASVIRKALATDGLGMEVFKAGGLRKAVDHLGRGIGFDRNPRSERLLHDGASVMRAVFGPIADAVCQDALEAAKNKGLRKATSAARAIPPPSLDAWRRLKKWLAESYQNGVDDTAKLLEHGLTADSALAYATEQAAALLGRSWDEDSKSWVDSESDYAVTPKIREAANELVQTAIEEEWTYKQLADSLGGIFTEERAVTIARTELGFAYNQGAIQNYAAVGVEKVVVRDGGTDGSCTDCDDVDGEVWTLEEAAADPLGHPNCTRGFLPYVDDQAEEAA